MGFRHKRFFHGDQCKFDIIRSKFFLDISNEKHTMIYYFSAQRGLEAINVLIIDRNLPSISQLPKIRKKQPAAEQSHVSSDFFRSTM